SFLEQSPDGWISLLPGPDLKGWTRVTIPPSNALGRMQWHLDPARGVLVCDGDGGHEMLRFDREFTNCVFHVEFRFTPVTKGKRGYNSGVFIRNSANGEIWYQAQLGRDGGYWFGEGPANGKVARFKLPPLEKKMEPAGEWNTIEVTARGKSLTAWLNGATTSTYEDCEQPSGYIAVEAEGYRIEFRNLKVKEMK
ncbi:MAG TPA: DUF1080 domain-containing protein, partial [Verrucomicrobiae bacterium]|nr:DUF1080 domain-containing protein [Verrucomicrobiae bacterium]